MQRTGRAAPASEEPHLRHPRAEVHNTALPRRGQRLRFCGVSMSAEWHITRQGKQYGPFTEEKLRELAATKRLAPGDLIWRQGMAEWVAAEKLKGLFPTQVMRKADMPQKRLPPNRTAVHAESDMPVIDVGSSGRRTGSAKQFAHHGRKKSQSKGLLISAGVGVFVLGVGAIAFLFMSERGESFEKEPQATRKSRSSRNPVEEFREYAGTVVTKSQDLLAGRRFQVQSGPFKATARFEIDDDYKIDVRKTDSMIAPYMGVITAKRRLVYDELLGKKDFPEKWVTIVIKCEYQENSWSVDDLEGQLAQ